MPIDRAPQLLTGFVSPPMARPMQVAPRYDSIFGNTYNGVPNPMVPHQHPYPTRYHGPVFRYPTPGWTYEIAPYARAPFDGDAQSEAIDKLAKKLLLWGSVGLVASVGLVYLLLKSERAR